MDPSKMVESIEHLTQQAHQGHVVAIVKILNQHLWEREVKVRGIFVNGILQLLCEATDISALEQSSLLEEIKILLDELAPPRIRQVNIYSRIIQEQQLLWLEEITRDLDNNVLWTDSFFLIPPSFWEQLQEDFRHLSRGDFEQSSLRWKGGLLAGVLFFILGFLGWKLYQDSQPSPQALVLQPSPPVSPSVSPSVTPPRISSQEAFVRAVRLAEEAAKAGKIANTRQDWLGISQKWLEASQLMEKVSPDYPRYNIAQDRMSLYLQNSKNAQQEATRY